ncbi:polyketide synthase [Penicillium odoratum]|uniref:polyketide synthase n=1 Tax=Penicillium odoratum TaxID=1167516 RepID=UPI002548947A|nr:polyketide synthase [Penicillium odoratum]KAJ5761266.1 polyketide synthase [Penicillium odoratum]
MRSELGLSFAVCETDTFDHIVISVFERFQRRRESTTLLADMEYLVHGDEVRTWPTGRSILKYQLATFLGGDDVEIEVYSVGLSDRDSCIAIGSTEVSHLVFGHEATGIIRRVGQPVKGFTVGDRVMALGQGLFASVFVQSEAFCVISQVSREISRIGLAAIQIAHSLQAKVFATVENDEQATYLVQMLNVQASNIFVISDLNFSESVRKATNDEGVDVVFNSVSVELIHECWLCVAEFSVIIETEILGVQGKQKSIPALNTNYSYYHVDIDSIQSSKPNFIKELLFDTQNLLTKRTIRLRLLQPSSVFSVFRIQDAFTELEDS